ncbi:shikimate dehydrogenase family protein [Celeribacter indicus]|uniref:Shikimate dehydrogenase substrate binding domain-containing protein n=1 Tax=Celeribacter indicus TaxID=1208324 RepID=A0A0B5DMJ6_9RHOB|nr:shikimate dehydrogenase [Celeribacter indicus]AJE44868.1 Shikimate dehydrogenase substrate binding domain-containing protein [Celeribacter indicus]SDX23150.1 shikimate dehydrogenase [Celeribacter indicus]
MSAPDILLGLIGDNIAASRSPRLHELAGEQNGLRVRYDRLVPQALGQSWEEIFDGLAAKGYRGTNITYPYKEKVVGRLTIDDPLVKAIGACNTVIFEGETAKGYNTDYSGFVAAYRRERGEVSTGITLMIGTGGVGRAVAFGLIALGAPEIRLVDMDRAKAEALAADLRAASPETAVAIFDSAAEGAEGAAGLINCTPVGMVGKEGTPLPASAMTSGTWAFDAVYTPADTTFLTDAQACGLDVISGWELFFYQGVHAWTLFTGLPLDEDRLRADLLA